MHCEPFAEHLWQFGWSLLHLTFEAAHASHEARSFGRRSLSTFEDLGAEVGEGTADVEIGASSTVGAGCHCCGVCGMKDIVAIVFKVLVSKICSVLLCLFQYRKAVPYVSVSIHAILTIQC